MNAGMNPGMNPGKNQDIHALAGAYVVDAVDEPERVLFEAHLASCPACQEEVASLRAAATELGTLAEQPPPERLRTDVLASIRNIRPLPPRPPQTTGDGRHAGEGGDELARRRRRRVRGLLAAAAVVLAVVGAGFAWHPWTSGNPAQQGRIAAMVHRVMTAPDSVRTTKPVTGGGTATLVRSAGLGRAALRLSHMPAPPAGKVYQLWLQRPNGHMVSAGLAPPGANQTLMLNGDAASARAAAISVEPAGGSPAPTTPPIALFSFT
ncbi:MAG: anti-sigma factor [Marmoricola sp.]